MSRRRLFVVGLVAALVSCRDAPGIYRHEPVVVMSPVRLDGAVVHGAKPGWYLASRTPPYSEPVPVLVTSYCLSGTTRRGRYVRAGIVAADPKFFPLSRYVELYVGKKYYGRFLVDDTGRRIRGAHLDVWLATCSAARRFGVQRGTAVLVPQAPTVRLAGKVK